ncbi:MAG: DegT/DnrJ/EryC1/StrS family aminotransferase [Bacteroidia bacterium]|nr:DegT/DnrJ/EryC1/StrS family aminotransferase [Bacteroidia bacterium]
MIPFSPPRVDQKTIDAVVEVLKSGWITTGPRTKHFERRLTEYNGNKATVALNSATAGLELALRWFGVREGDEVILPAYTYAATANVVVHCGAKPVFVDVNPDDFNISLPAIKKAVNSSTKVIMPVDFGGFPCDYIAINALVNEKEIKALFSPVTPEQKKLGRILVLSDAAHSIGATMGRQRTGSLTDISVFSFHTVKNLTTSEGGAIALNLEGFDNEAVYRELCIKGLHGQNKDALAKMQKGNWRYDIVEPGFKCNMTDIVAAIGLVELDRYESETLPRRKAICDLYSERFSKKAWAELPVMQKEGRRSCYHLYPLRLRGATEDIRDAIIRDIFEQDVSVNVHFVPVPMMSYYKNRGYSVLNYPTAYDNYSRVITLPVYFDLSPGDQEKVIAAVIHAVEKNLG